MSDSLAGLKRRFEKFKRIHEPNTELFRAAIKQLQDRNDKITEVVDNHAQHMMYTTVVINTLCEKQGVSPDEVLKSLKDAIASSNHGIGNRPEAAGASSSDSGEQRPAVFDQTIDRAAPTNSALEVTGSELAAIDNPIGASPMSGESEADSSKDV